MSDIKVGDLVQIVRWTCCGAYLGIVFKVAEIERYDAAPRCATCKADIAGFSAVAHEGRGKQYWSAPTIWLKRIPPLSELDDVKQDEEITA